MKRLVVVVLVGLWGWQGSVSPAQEEAGQPLPEPTPPPTQSAPLACPSPCIPPVEKTLSSYKLFLQDHEAATTIPRLTIREVEICKEKQHSLELAWHEEKFTCTEMTFKEREVEQEVTCLTVQPETTVDPHTGQPCTVYKQVPVVKKVTVKVFEPVPKEKEYVVRYPYVKPRETDVVVKQLAIDHITIPGIENTLSVIPVPCEARVVVPVLPFPCLPK
jgi:hypothetical protein